VERSSSTGFSLWDFCFGLCSARLQAGATQPLTAMPTLVLKSLQSLKDYVDREIATTDWLVVTQERIQQFAEATGDRQWIHVDPERAQRESPYGATIAHGFLTLSLMNHL
jgi:acyl dehydratase